MRSSGILLAALVSICACSKSSDTSSGALEHYQYSISTAKRVVYPPAVEVFLGQERLGVLGDYRDNLERYDMDFDRPLSAPLSASLGEGLSLRWQSPCDLRESKLSHAQAVSYIVEREAGQKKHGSGRANLEVEEDAPQDWASKATIFWADTKADEAELRVGEVRVKLDKGEGVRVFAVDCADSLEVELEGAKAQLDTKALAAANERGWDKKVHVRHVFLGQPGQCYALREITYQKEGEYPIGPKTTPIVGGEIHILPGPIHYFLKDAPSAVEFEFPADEAGLRSSIARYELKTSECGEAKPSEQTPSCVSSCRASGGTEAECSQVCDKVDNAQ